MKEQKEPLDILLVNRKLAPSREKAKAIIMAGIVYVNGQKEDKPGAAFDKTADVQVRGTTLRYVSRGGLKLEKAVDCFGVELEGKICMDVGSSTGGFTDCMLQNGAQKVYAVDVGHGQLDWKLRNDKRVVCMERTNIRYVTRPDIEDGIEFASIDVSFISLTKVLGPVKGLLTEDGQIVALIKPQFEAGREKVGKKGVVREKSTHLEVIQKVMNYALGLGFEILNLEYSPVKGPEGNIEYLVYLQKHGEEDGGEDLLREPRRTRQGAEESVTGEPTSAAAGQEPVGNQAGASPAAGQEPVGNQAGASPVAGQEPVGNLPEETNSTMQAAESGTAFCKFKADPKAVVEEAHRNLQTG